MDSAAHKRLKLVKAKLCPYSHVESFGGYRYVSHGVIIETLRSMMPWNRDYSWWWPLRDRHAHNRTVSRVTSDGRTVVDTQQLIEDPEVRRFLDDLSSGIDNLRQAWSERAPTHR